MKFKIVSAPLGRNNTLKEQAVCTFVKYKDKRTDVNAANSKVTVRVVHIIEKNNRKVASKAISRWHGTDCLEKNI